MKIKILPEFHLNKTEDDMNLEFKEYYTGKNKYEGFIINNILYITSFIIPMVLLSLLMFTFGFAPFGSKSMFVVDGAINNIPVLTQLIAQIHSGSFQLFSLHGSTGNEMFSTLFFYAASPFTIICLFFDQATAIGLLSIFTILRIALSAPLFLFYLTHKPIGRKGSKYDISLLIFALGYSLSSYALVQYNDFMFMDIFMLFPLFMLGFERILCKQSPKLYILILSLCLFSNYYLGCILLGTSFFLYFFMTRLIIKEAIYHLRKLFIYNLISLSISAVTVVPGMFGLFLSFIKNQHFPDPQFLTNFWTLLLEHFFYSTPSYANTESYGSNLYIGSLILILVTLHFFDQTLSFKKRVTDFVLLALYIFSMLFSANNHIFQLLVGRESSFSCFSFIYLSIILIWSFESIYHIRDNSIWKIVSSCIFPIFLAVLALNLANPLPNFDSVNFTIDLCIILSIILLLYRLGSIKRNITYILLVSITVLELLANAFQNYYIISQEEIPLTSVLTKTGNTEYFGSLENGRSEIYHDILAEDTNSFSLFSRNSNNTLIPHQSIDENPLSDSFSGLKYVLCIKGNDKYSLKQSNFSYIGSDENYDIYENKYVFPTAFSVKKLAPKVSYNSSPTIHYNEIAKDLGATEDIFINSNITPVVTTSKKDTINVDALGNNVWSFSKQYNKEIASYDFPYYYRMEYTFTPTNEGDLYISTPELRFYDHVLPNTESSFKIFDELSIGNDVLYSWNAYYFNETEMKRLADVLNNNRCSISAFGLNSYKISTTDCTEESTILSILPYSDSISLYINGIKSDNFFNYENHLAIPVNSGIHDIIIIYEYIPFYIGLWISIFSIIILVLASFLMKKKAKVTSNNQRPHWLDNIMTFCTDNYVYLLSFIIPGIAFLAFSLYMNYQPFGYTTIFADDGLQIELPNIYGSVREIQKGNTLHAWNGGGGYQVGSPSWFLNIIPLIVSYVIPIKYLSIYSAFLQVIRICLLGPSVVFYLCHQLNFQKANKKDIQLLIPAMTYSMSSFMIMMLCYPGWYTGYILLPFVALGMDYLIIKNKKRYYILALAVLMTKSYYIGMFICFYLVIRFFTYRYTGIKDFIIKGLRFALCSLSVLGLCAVTILGTLQTINQSTYGEETTSIPSFHTFDTWGYYINQLLARSPHYRISWSEGSVNLYFGLLPIILLFTFFLSKNIKILDKIRATVPLIVFTFALNNALLNYIFNGLHYQTGVPNRFAFLIPFIVSTIIYYVLIIWDKEKLITIIMSIILPCFVFALAFIETQKSKEYTQSIIISSIILLIYLITIIIFKICANKRKSLTLLLIFFFCAELISNAFSQIKESDADLYLITDLADATDYLKENHNLNDTLERVSVSGALCQNYSKIYDLKSTHIFAAGAITPYQLAYASLIGNSTSRNVLRNEYSNTLIGDALACNRYIVKGKLTHAENCTDLKYYNLIRESEKSYIWENPYCFPFAYGIPQHLKESTEDCKATVEFWDSMAWSMIADNNMISLSPIYSYDSAKTDRLTNNTYEAKINTDAKFDQYNVHLELDIPCDGMAYINVSDFLYLGEVKKGEHISTDLNFENYRISSIGIPLTLVIINKDDFLRLYDSVWSHPLEIDSFTDSTIDGHIDMPESAYVNFSMPYDSNWKAYVDEKLVESSPMANAFYTIPVSSGKHKIHLAYEVKKDYKYPIIMFISWSIFLMSCIIKTKKDQHHSSNNVDSVSEKVEFIQK